VRLLAGGAGVPHHAVAWWAARAPTLVRTDAAGRATIAAAERRRWLLRATGCGARTMRRWTGESEFATLTVAVGVR
jgi:hypothetical protein